MIQKLEMEEEKVPELCVSLYKQYGTTMAGLKVKAVITFFCESRIHLRGDIVCPFSPGYWLQLRLQ